MARVVSAEAQGAGEAYDGVAATGWHYGDGTSSPELGGGDWKTEE